MSKFSDITERNKTSNEDEIKKIVNGGKVNIKSSSAKNVPLQVMISPEIRNDIKVMAAVKGVRVNELFTEIYEFYKANHE